MRYRDWRRGDGRKKGRETSEAHHEFMMDGGGRQGEGKGWEKWKRMLVSLVEPTI